MHEGCNRGSSPDMITWLPLRKLQVVSSASNAERAERHITAVSPNNFSQARAERKWRLPVWRRSCRKLRHTALAACRTEASR
jgi:hypothetical protein